MKKSCLLFETLGKVSDLQVMESSDNKEMRLHGIFGVCGVRNNNNRIYDKENYRQMVESLQKTIKESGCPGELEHPNSMNITLENVSHKIEDIQMNEDGTITGTILLLNTPKGQIAKAIVEGGLPLYISSRGAGTITNESGVSHVTLSTIKTYDLVGTPGFSQAKLSLLKDNQTLECLNESANDGNVMYAIVEDDDEDDKKSKKDKEDSEDESKEKPKKSKDDKEDKEDNEDKKDKKETKDKSETDDNKNNDDNNIDMKELKEAIKELTDKVTSLEAELHVAKESLNDIKPTNYDAIQQWVLEEALTEFNDNFETYVNNKLDNIIETLSNGVQNWVVEEFAPEVQNWVVEEFAPEVQDWVVEEFAPEVQSWVVEEFAPEVQDWVVEEFAPEVQGWICEEFASEVQNWIVEEYSPEVQNWIVEEYSPEVQNWIVEEYSNDVQNWIVEEYSPEIQGWITEEFAPVIDSWINEEFTPNLIESQNAGRLQEIDSLLESISSENSNKQLENIILENATDEKYKGIYVVENIPDEYVPQWELLSESRKDEIIRSSRMYDFTKAGVLESFWSNVDFNKEVQKPINENNNDAVSHYKNNVALAMKYLQQR